MKTETLYGGLAVAILTDDDRPIAFLQGEEAEELIEDIDAIKAGVYPLGAFPTEADAVNYYLSAYGGQETEEENA